MTYRAAHTSVRRRVQDLDRLRAILRHLRYPFRHPRVFWALFVETIGAFYAAKCPRLGASLAFYTLLSMTPLLVVVIGIAGMLYGADAARGEIVRQIEDQVGRQGAEVIQGVLHQAWRMGSGIIATTAGILTLFLGATGVMAELRDAMNTIWNLPPRPGDERFFGIVGVLKGRLYSFLMILAVGFLLLLSLAVNTFLALAGRYFNGILPVSEVFLQTVDFWVGFFITTVLFALIYKLVPDAAISWSDVAVGAVVTSLLFNLGKLLIALYIGKSTVASAYGAAGSLVLFQLWVYYSAQVFFFGAEFTQVYANKYGSRLTSRHRKAARELEIAEG